jgi:hypothetical protein
VLGIVFCEIVHQISSWKYRKSPRRTEHHKKRGSLHIGGSISMLEYGRQLVTLLI